MKYDRFEQLPVWRAGMELAERVYVLTDCPAFNRVREVRDQIRRSSLSVSNNVAEGFERGTTAELLSFLYIARGSAGETRSILLFCQSLISRGVLKDSESQITNRKSEISNLKSQTANSKSETSNLRSEISNLKSEISSLVSLAESCSRQIRAWADNLQNSDIQGPRRLNDQTRENYRSQRRIDAFMDELQRVRDKAAVRPSETP